ncbi:unnamed protein product [Cylicocyclus nassatus]|uniref:Acyl-CoA oxidase C-alpha1 domain-containing protein n=1 Tax=Cylicocyclus nassatus TaxID=53992 RepID=A0AA36HH22_CYLNA|nr:unnamed protein product [Cylicocyclus nassatus]
MYTNPTGLGLEIAYFNMLPGQKEDLSIKPLDAHSLLPPEAIEAWFYLYRMTGSPRRYPSKHAKISNSIMVHVRAHMVRHQAMFAAYAMKTAIRYLAIRLQGEITPGAGEVKISDCQIQQYRLLPQLARTFAFLLTGQAVKNIYVRVQREWPRGR